MSGATAKGYPYPTGGDAVTDGDDAIKALAEKVDTQLGTIARGAVTFPGLSTSIQTMAVTFPAGRFTAAPNVVVSVQGSDPSGRQAGVNSTATTSGVTLCGKAVNSTAGSYSVHWIAVQA
jgi:hypothetical protein